MNGLSPRHEEYPRLRVRSELPPQVHNYALLRRIGGGASGDVWLARGITGALHAIKVVERRRVVEARAYEREFKGVTHFQPISGKHPAFVNILHVGRNEKAGYFYCIMELADDGLGGSVIDPPSYVPHTLGWEVDERGPLPLDRCLQIVLTLTDGLQYLHNQGLVHRDLKPTNIIRANELWKLADIGLVTQISETATNIGTPGYMDPWGPGHPLADIYSLGMVLYKISTGRNPADFLKVPEEFANDDGRWRKFFELVRIAL